MDNIATDGWPRWSADTFWMSPPSLPNGLMLERQHAVRFSPRSGPRGQDPFEEVLLKGPSVESRLLVAYKAPLLAREIPMLKQRLSTMLDELRRQEHGAVSRIGAVCTDLATPAVREVCTRELVGLIDQGGTVIVHDGAAYVHVQGAQKVKRRRQAALFRGKSTRILRLLLASPGVPLLATEISKAAQTSFAYCHAVLTRLEDEGYLDRRSPRTGFRLVRPVDLLRAWVDSDYRGAATVDGFYAPSTSPQDLDRVARTLKQAAAPFALTLMSATPAEDVFVGGAPHGIYLGGDDGLVIEALHLRKITPHNFLILRPELHASVVGCGVFDPERRRVSEPQLILDYVAYGGARGREQADHLMKRWADRLPLLSHSS